MPSQTISLSMMSFESDQLMSVDADQGRTAQLVCDAPPREVDLMLSLVSEPESIVLEDYRSNHPSRKAG